jgi:hypothetical protein
MGHFRPIQIVLQQAADRDGSFFQASMTIIHASGLLEIHPWASETGHMLFRGK